MEENTAAAPAEQTEGIDNQQAAIRDAEAVLRKNEELLAENRKLKQVARQAEGFDFERARTAIEALERAEEEKLAKKGEFDKLLEQKQRAWEERISGIAAERDGILTNLKREKLANVLAEKGVLPDRARFLVRELESDIELASDESGFSLRKVGGVGDAAEFDAIVETVKQKYPFFFGASLNPGSGASGQGGTGGPGPQNGAGAGSRGRTMRASDFRKLPVAERYTLAREGVSLTED